MNNINYDKIFEEFLSLYKREKILIEWGHKSFGIRLNNVTSEERNGLEKKEFKKFIGDLLTAVEEKVNNSKVTDDMDKYVRIFLEEEKDLASHILIQSNSLLNTCRSVDYELLTKMNNELNVIGYSLLLNLGIETANSHLEAINFELSLKDLKFLYNTLGEAIHKIEKLG